MQKSELKYHYSNPAFEGKPWSIDRKKKAKSKKAKKKLWRKEKQLVLKNPHEAKCRGMLSGFWETFSALPNTDSRLGHLRIYAAPGWNRVGNALRLALRKQFAKKYRSLLANIDEYCGICGDMPWREKHHIIPLAYGGINEDLNLIAICTKCHDEIHPWMKA